MILVRKRHKETGAITIYELDDVKKIENFIQSIYAYQLETYEYTFESSDFESLYKYFLQEIADDFYYVEDERITLNTIGKGKLRFKSEWYRLTPSKKIERVAKRNNLVVLDDDLFIYSDFGVVATFLVSEDVKVSIELKEKSISLDLLREVLNKVRAIETQFKRAFK
jgi:hypothetical protein